MKKLEIQDDFFDEFIVIMLIGLHECYQEGAMDISRLYQWFLNGKISRFISSNAKSEKVQDLYETFEEIMRFEDVNDRDIINFDSEFNQIKEKLMQFLKTLNHEGKAQYILSFID